MMLYDKKNIRRERGFTIFFAILIIALLLAVTTSISLLSSKQLQLLTLGNQSEVAFYAADSGAECALYWDKNEGTPGPFDPNASDGATVSIPCGGNSVIATKQPSDTTQTSSAEIWSFTAHFGSTCAAVTVAKSSSNPSNPANGVWITDIDSRGYDGDCTGSELERALHYHY